MNQTLFLYRTKIAAPAKTVYDWHVQPGAFEHLSPQRQRVQVVERTGDIEEGTRATILLPFGPVSVRWTLEHCDVVTGKQFREVQLRGPFKCWEHTHRFRDAGPRSCYLEDIISYKFGQWIAGIYVKRNLDRLFAHRHAVTIQDLQNESDENVPSLVRMVTPATITDLSSLTAPGQNLLKKESWGHGGR